MRCYFLFLLDSFMSSKRDVSAMTKAAAASGILYPLFHVTMKPEWAGLAMAMSSVTVVSLSLMLKRFQPATRGDG